MFDKRNAKTDKTPTLTTNATYNRARKKKKKKIQEILTVLML